jgi:hypothetical protein
MVKGYIGFNICDECCEEDECIGCQCDSESSVQIDGIYTDDGCSDCNLFSTIVVPKVTSFTTLTFGDTCKSTSCGDPCVITGEGTAPICYYQTQEDEECVSFYIRVSIHQIAGSSDLMVMVSLVTVGGIEFVFSDIQARTGCGVWEGTCDTIDMDIDLDEVCIEGSVTKACILPDTVHVTVL